MPRCSLSECLCCALTLLLHLSCNAFRGNWCSVHKTLCWLSRCCMLARLATSKEAAMPRCKIPKWLCSASLYSVGFMRDDGGDLCQQRPQQLMRSVLISMKHVKNVGGEVQLDMGG